MRKILCIAALFLGLWGGEAKAQGRKYISQFGFFKNYYNPGLTAYEGSTVRGFTRNQWSGFEGAPQTYFVGTELDISELLGDRDPYVMGRNAIGLNIMHDTYGPFRETEVMLSYANRIRLTEVHNLRFGVGVSYSAIRLDGASLTPDEENDPVLNKYLGGFANMSMMDFNFGIALTHELYYLGYAIHNASRGGITSGDVFFDDVRPHSVFSGGFRQLLNPNISLVVNGMYRTQNDLPGNMEFNTKLLLMDSFWIGGGHRFDYSTNLQVGFLVLNDILRVGYIYEFGTGAGQFMQGVTNEFTVTYNIFRDYNRIRQKEVLIW
ncbi:PorP/SprF family type IX secretion system membrane protein [Pararhodonellum marinum]|uniref:PorP/SprF family type IX secretion system membrane protein n=1 Tax=Pararhodonellum marinum TaxID=2755358 RepID=UPI0018905C41|nr:type IX secretion system membrane protein PorP/SprF [Pararhodonellum marinum]